MCAADVGSPTWPTLATAVWNALSREGHFWRWAYFSVRVRKSSLFPLTHVLLTSSCRQCILQD